MKKSVVLTLMAMVVMAVCAPATFAAEAAEATAAGVSGEWNAGLIAIGAGLAVGLAGLATANAQAAVGAGGTGAMAEKPELFTNVLILFAIPETIVILGFVIGFLLLGKI